MGKRLNLLYVGVLVGGLANMANTASPGILNKLWDRHVDKRNLEYNLELAPGEIYGPSPQETLVKLNTMTQDRERYQINSIRDEKNEKNLLARTLLGEAENCDYAEKMMIGYAVLNRRGDRWQENGEANIHSVLLKPWQFSCLNGPKEKGTGTYKKSWGRKKCVEDVNLKKVLDPMYIERKINPDGNPESDNEVWNRYIERKGDWEQCLQAAEDIIAGKYPQLNMGQIWYHAKTINKPKSWTTANKITNFPIQATFGRKINLKHFFYYHKPPQRKKKLSRKK